MIQDQETTKKYENSGINFQPISNQELINLLFNQENKENYQYLPISFGLIDKI